jgi:hypothetical protein
MKHLAFALVSLTIAAQYASAADSPFAGSWKFNPAKSQLTGDTFSFSTSAIGLHYSDGAAVEYDFAVDGNDYPVIADRKVSWTKRGDNVWDSVMKDGKGVVLYKAHRVLSKDGKKLSISYKYFRPDGTTSEGSDEYVRVSGDKGLPGEWKNVQSKQASDKMIISVPSPGKVTVEFPSYKQTATGPTDGTPIAVIGPTVPQGVFVAYTATGTSKMTFAITLNGKVFQQGERTVSSDGKTLTEVSWLPGKESEKEVDVYDRE